MSSDVPPRGRRPAQGEPVVDRAFKLLAAFAPTDPSLSLSALSTRSGLPKSTTLRLARKLVQFGALERNARDEYVIGLRLFELASLAPRGHGLRATALPFMEDLHHATRHHVLLAVREGEEAVLVDRLSARGAGQVMYRVGGRLPLHSTGVGLVLLAHAPADVQSTVLAGNLRLMPENVAVPGHELRRRLAAIRHDGVAVISRPYPEPMAAVAAPIYAGAKVVAAISVVAPAEQPEPVALTPAVVAVARAISRAMARDAAEPASHSHLSH